MGFIGLVHATKAKYWSNIGGLEMSVLVSNTRWIKYYNWYRHPLDQYQSMPNKKNATQPNITMIPTTDLLELRIQTSL